MDLFLKKDCGIVKIAEQQLWNIILIASCINLQKADDTIKAQVWDAELSALCASNDDH